jgi:hypothetical protein
MTRALNGVDISNVLQHVSIILSKNLDVNMPFERSGPKTSGREHGAILLEERRTFVEAQQTPPQLFPSKYTKCWKHEPRLTSQFHSLAHL